MKIAQLETFTDEFVCFIKVTTDSGMVGWGQTSTYNADITATVFHRQVVPWVLGRDATDIQALIDLVEAKEHKYPGSYRCRALAGLDTALWDLHGHIAGKPVVELLGGRPGRLRAYASSMKRDITPQDEARRLVALRDRDGFTAFKWRVAAECGRDVDEWPGRTEEIVPTVARAVGHILQNLDPAIAIPWHRVVNARGEVSRSPSRNGGDALQQRLLEQEGIGHFEEPCPYWQLEQTKIVTAALSLDVTGGEQDWDLATWQRMIDLRAVDIVQPDVMYMGGLTRTLTVARMAQHAGLPVTPHSANLSLVTMCTMHLLGAIPNAGKYLELSIEGADYYPWQQDLFLGDPYRVVDGHVTIPAEPGWGVEINPQWLARAAYRSATLE